MLQNAPWKELREVLLYGDHFKTALTLLSTDIYVQQSDWKKKFWDYTEETVEINAENVIFHLICFIKST